MEYTMPEITPRVTPDVALASTRNYWRLRRRREAKFFGHSEFIAGCDEHGETLFDTASGYCLTCEAEGKIVMTRAAARARGDTFYPSHCERCGPAVEHHVSCGKCAACFNSVGRPRVANAAGRPGSNPRAEARREGSTYVAECAVHGATAHHVNSGKCWTCYTANGGLRKGRSARAVAREAGAKRYVGHCAVHGETEHHVTCGKCATCFNSGGAPRPGLAGAKPAHQAGELSPVDLNRTERNGPGAAEFG